MKSKQIEVQKLFKNLCDQTLQPFPKKREPLNAPTTHGVYVIRKGSKVAHVGRTLRGKHGLHQRLSNHLQGASSFTQNYLNGSGSKLREGYTFQHLEVKGPRLRALVEAYAIGILCPEHLGLGD